MKQQFKRTLISSAVLSASLGGMSSASYGQGTALEEVVVTATRRDQSVQEVPYNISAITGNDMIEQGLASPGYLERSTLRSMRANSLSSLAPRVVESPRYCA